MKTEDLQAQGLTEEQIKFVFAENGKDIAAEKKRAEKAEQDRDIWKKRAETAEETLQGFEGKDFEAIEKERNEWKEKAENSKKDYEKQIYDRDFGDALTTEMEQYKFSSEYAKAAVMAELKSAGLKLIDGKIIGLTDMIESIKSKDASAFVTEEQENKAQFTQSPFNNDKKSEPVTGDPNKMDFDTYKKWREQNK